MGTTLIALAVMVAGALGAVTRFVVDGAVKWKWPTITPWGTFVINVSGSALLGVLAGLVLFHGAPHELQAIIGTGFCGGYTTFSTASFEVVRLAENKQRLVAGAYAVLTLLVSAAACAAGLAVVWAV
ncbi:MULTISPECIES: fluoride efflux transporter FluC [Gordonia]|jgi:CrcB protein|uniref:Fluoride-specific ion channel FluC n=1 Tax=Gordonia namibiensis NBRC 108229 TaxID=1208314 RepID=K6XK44_9ACTN|nr:MULTISPECIES: CrcB family protein [Gordonia]MCK8615751.1 CrcB family protein [Gordonia sp. C13]MDH3010591.1 CrcB family protein [Gordonia alkanivorans]MDH3018189.1 CrcB family protein [Gordonia alkanivorans]MDH3020051.1 CrcB family protein [Gordonia alkanivorans]MDH3023615.1 CrcB family protein [Gordonia alkanivorans]